MAVKVRDQVTVVDLTDVQSVTIYYLLQLSTLSVPSRPTSINPSNWSTTEPAFTSGTTNTLYTCVRTLYKNGTYAWGEVNVSSSYEAAKAAWNKAQAAQDTADSIDLTGLVKFTDLATAGSTTINGGNITTGKITAIDLEGVNITGSTIVSDSSARSKITLNNGSLYFRDETTTPPTTTGRIWSMFHVNNSTGLATRTLFITQEASDVDIVLGDPLSGPNININRSGVDIDGVGLVDPGVRITGNMLVNGKSLVDTIYPVGSIYMSVNSTSPATLFGGSWTQLKDRFLLGAGNSYSNGSTGGSATHILTTAEMPSHRHRTTPNDGYWVWGGSARNDKPPASSTTSYWTRLHDITSEYAGGGSAHNNMPPYLAVYMWRRTA